MALVLLDEMDTVKKEEDTRAKRREKKESTPWLMVLQQLSSA